MSAEEALIPQNTIKASLIHYKTEESPPRPTHTHNNIHGHNTKHRGVTVVSQSERGVYWLMGDSPRPPPASDANEPLAPSFTQGKCSGLAWRPGWQWGVCSGRKADSWGRRLSWMGAALWHTEPGTEASTDGRWAARLQGDSHSTFRMAVSQRAARERGGGRRTRGGRRPNTRYSWQGVVSPPTIGRIVSLFDNHCFSQPKTSNVCWLKLH